MTTDEYTTYKCEGCRKHKPIDQVYNIFHFYGRSDIPDHLPRWHCRECVLAKVEDFSCDRCYLDNGKTYKFNDLTLCGPCISEMQTAQDALKENDPDLWENDFGTGEPEEEHPFIVEAWEVVTREAV